MAITAACRISIFSLICQFVFFLNWPCLCSGLSFVDGQFKHIKVIIERNVATNLSISCRTTDPNATVTLFHTSANKEVLVGGRVTLDKQVFTIHSISSISDAGLYQCTARNSLGTVTIQHFVSVELFNEVISLSPQETPERKIVLAGASVNFTCTVDLSKSFPKYLSFKWFKGEAGTFVEISANQTHRHNDSSSVLMIKNAKTTPLVGILYMCQVSYKGYTSGYNPRLVVLSGFSPNITFLNQPGPVNEPNKMKIVCKVTGYRVAKVTWLQNDVQMSLCLRTDSNNCSGQNYQVMESPKEGRVVIYSDLIIVSTKYPRDHANYTCVATNSEGRGQKTVEVAIYTVPKLVKSKPFWITNQIFCKVNQTNPLPTFTWQHQIGSCLDCKPDDNEWRDTTTAANFVISPGVDVATTMSTLTIPKGSQSGLFRCVARNVRGSDAYVMSFFASGDDRIQLMTPLKKYVYNEDESLKVRCVVVCKNTMISWYKDGQQLTSASDPRVNITQAPESDKTRSNLIVQRLVANDSGTYTCKARDCISGQQISDSKNITVKKVFPPSVLEFRNQTIYLQTTVDLFCNISANPAPTVQWYKDKQPLEDKIEELNKVSCSSLVQGFYRIKDNDGRLVICKPENAVHTGFYTCIATNSRGKSNATAFLDVLADPVIVSPSKESQTQSVKLGKPWNITCKATGNPAPTVEWKRENGNKSMSPKQHSSAVLSFDSVSDSDFGIYFCVAVNSKDVAYAYVEVVSADLLPTKKAPQGLKKEIIIALAVGGSVLFIFFLLLIVCCAFFHRQRQQIKEYRSQFFPYIEHREIDGNRTLHEQCDNLAYDPDWEFPEERLILGEVLGSGAFGQVIKAEAIGITEFNPRDKSPEKVRRRSKMLRRSSSSRMYHDSRGTPYVKTTVAVKTLKSGATTAEFKDLASELKILIHVGEHKNIVNLLGACTKGDRLLIIMEFAPHGNLLKFLRGKREIYEPTWVTTTNNPEVELTITNLVGFAYQISRGMEFLASKKCIHRDLATRNVLVGEEYVIKVADFGLARDVYKSDMYVKATNAGVLPVKWMALESLFDRLYTEKSDVWSFGICLWEIFTLGGTPYPGIPTEQLLDFLSEGHRMDQPHNCPMDMYAIMTDCWLQKPEQRPTFTQLTERIGRILEFHTSKQVSSAYITLTEETKPKRNDYYIDPVDSGSTLPQASYTGYNRQSSEDIAHSPLPALPRDAEAEQDLEPDERHRMLEPANGSLSGNESGIGLEDGSDEMPSVAELRPLRNGSGFDPNLRKGRKISKSKETFV